MSRSIKSSTCSSFSLNLRILLENPVPCKSAILNRLSAKTTIKSLKAIIEQDVGILSEMYTLGYLDACPLLDETTLHDNFIVKESTVVLRPWKMWNDILYHCYTGTHGLCANVKDITGPSDWCKHRAWVALYIASHHGHHNLVINILRSTQAPINATSHSGSTALHAAARTGHWKVLCILLDKGADVRLKDNKGQSAFDLARKYGHKKCEDSLNFCQWNLQKHYIVKKRSTEYDANNARRTAQRQSHLSYDSTLSTWLHGKCGQTYMAHIPNHISVKDVKEYNQKAKVAQLPPIEDDHESDSCDERFDFDYGWFDKIRAQQLIPCTHDVVTYANPSSCALQPRSLLNPNGYKLLVSHPSSKKTK